MLSPEAVRKLNLIEVLTEEIESQGQCVPQLPDNAAEQWSEDEIRWFFQKLQLGDTNDATLKCSLSAKRKWQDPSPEVFSTWFPGLPLSRTACDSPRLRVLCFPCAGSAEDMYTSEGTGVRRAPSPLLEWCRANEAEVLAVQLPGRGARLKEPYCASAQDVAEQLLPVVASRLASGIPYVVISHSMGCWCAFELLVRARQYGLPMPSAWFLSAMPSPDIPWDARPWRQQRFLSEEQFKDECKGWDINDLVFTPAMWSTFQPLLRSDFNIFDEYQFNYELAVDCRLHEADTRTYHGAKDHQIMQMSNDCMQNIPKADHQPQATACQTTVITELQPFSMPMVAFYGSQDRRVKGHMVKAWSRFTTAAFEVHEIQGNHLWPLHKEPKRSWLDGIADKLESLFN